MVGCVRFGQGEKYATFFKYFSKDLCPAGRAARAARDHFVVGVPVWVRLAV
jgi:hypothetical protein